MEAGTFAGEAYPGGQDPSLSWTIQGTGDFDADGHADIMSLRAPAYSGWNNEPAPVDPSWRVEGGGDFDGDAHADILRRHTGGQVAV